MPDNILHLLLFAKGVAIRLLFCQKGVHVVLEVVDAVRRGIGDALEVGGYFGKCELGVGGGEFALLVANEARGVGGVGVAVVLGL